MINVRCYKHFTAMAMRLTLLMASICVGGLSLASNIPRKPTNLQVTSVHNLTITLTWTKPLTTADTPISTSLNYKVTYTVIGSGNSQNSVTVKTESAQLNLQDDKKYNIHVKAIRTDDYRIQSPWSETLRVDSKNLAPGKPTNLIETRRSGMVVQLAWQKPQVTVNGIPDTSDLCYKIRYRKLGSSSTRQFPLCTSGGSLALLANSKYHIDVKAYKQFNARVSGPWSDPLTVQTTESKPSKPPTHVTAVSNTPSSITVHWDRIPESGRNGIIQGYVVFYREQSSSSWTERDVKLNRSVELTNLQTGKQYSVCVAGYTKVGRGVKSLEIQNVFVGGQLKSTKKTIVLTTPKTTTTTKQTTKLQLSSKSSILLVKTAFWNTPKTTITEPSERTTVQLISPLPGVVVSRDDKTKKSSDSKTVKETKTEPVVRQSTPAVALFKKENDSKSGFSNKILMIGVSAAGGLSLLIILIFVFVLARRRTRKRRLPNGEIPLQQVTNGRRRLPNDVVTRGTSSVRYEPPHEQSSFGFTDDSMTQRLLQMSYDSDRGAVATFNPNGHLPSGGLPRPKAETVPLLPADDYCPEKCQLRVDLNSGSGELAGGSASRLYESIGCLLEDGKTTANSDEGQRYVTRDQMAVSPNKCPLDLPAQTSLQERYNRAPTTASSQGHIYQNVQDSEHAYDTLNSPVKQEAPYENTRILPSPPVNNSDKDAGYERIPFI